jgi:hypothetical protein
MTLNRAVVAISYRIGQIKKTQIWGGKRPGPNPYDVIHRVGPGRPTWSNETDIGIWSGVRESNPCKSAWKADAQPLGQPRALHRKPLPEPLYGTAANGVNACSPDQLDRCRASATAPGRRRSMDQAPAAPKFATAGLPSTVVLPANAHRARWWRDWAS